jgi:hypothetical protein
VFFSPHPSPLPRERERCWLVHLEEIEESVGVRSMDEPPWAAHKTSLRFYRRYMTIEPAFSLRATNRSSLKATKVARSRGREVTGDTKEEEGERQGKWGGRRRRTASGHEFFTGDFGGEGGGGVGE